jgi:hypothetical protein
MIFLEFFGIFLGAQIRFGDPLPAQKKKKKKQQEPYLDTFSHIWILGSILSPQHSGDPKQFTSLFNVYPNLAKPTCG